MNIKKILLTGSTSFLGTKFLKLYGYKYDITKVSRLDPKNPIDLNIVEDVTSLFNQVKPDAIVHLAATLGQDAGNIDVLEVDVKTTKHLIDLAKQNQIPFVYTSSESIYNDRAKGMYQEDDDYSPRSDYAKSKMLSENYLKSAGIPYLITRGHRYIGCPEPSFTKPKQFTEAIAYLVAGKTIHLDNKKLFNPVLIDDICNTVDHYISYDSDKKIVLNVGIPEAITYYRLVSDIAIAAGLNSKLVLPDGDEPAWLVNNVLSTEKLKSLGYPQSNYEHIVASIANDYDL